MSAAWDIYRDVAAVIVTVWLVIIAVFITWLYARHRHGKQEIGDDIMRDGRPVTGADILRVEKQLRKAQRERLAPLLDEECPWCNSSSTDKCTCTRPCGRGYCKAAEVSRG